MKKIVLCTTLLFFGMVGISSATTFSETKNLNVLLTEGTILNWITNEEFNTYTYNHSTPSDFEVPYDIVNSATLKIAGYWIDGNDNSVAVEGTAVGNLTPGGSQGSNLETHGSPWIWNWELVKWDTPSLSTFDIAPTFSSWATGDPFSVTIDASDGLFDGILKLSSSTFTIDYDNGAAPAPVPEPSTILLMGMGLAGLVGCKRKKSNKKA